MLCREGKMIGEYEKFLESCHMEEFLVSNETDETG